MTQIRMPEMRTLLSPERILRLRRCIVYAVLIGLVGTLAGCGPESTLPPAPPPSALPSAEYRIGPGDALEVFVWHNPELSISVPVRPDGRISMPLIEDIIVVGKTPTSLGRELERRLAKYIADPIVTVIPRSFVGPFAQQVRVIGEAVTPRAISYRANMTVLDAIIEVGGLTKYASGDRTILVRIVNNTIQTYRVQLDRLIKYGDIDSNVSLAPGDILIIPQAFF
jgi:polysaccharide export outer membrane protein